jgi:hypothetical protein
MLDSAGVKRYVYNLTNSFGFSKSYDSVLDMVEGLKEVAAVHIHSQAKASIFGLVYDNCELIVSQSEQTLRDGNGLHSITSTLVIPSIEHPPDPPVCRSLRFVL